MACRQGFAPWEVCRYRRQEADGPNRNMKRLDLRPAGIKQASNRKPMEPKGFAAFKIPYEQKIVAVATICSNDVTEQINTCSKIQKVDENPPYDWFLV